MKFSVPRGVNGLHEIFAVFSAQDDRASALNQLGTRREIHQRSCGDVRRLVANGCYVIDGNPSGYEENFP